jgi:hypothetical protein
MMLKRNKKRYKRPNFSIWIYSFQFDLIQI